MSRNYTKDLIKKEFMKLLDEKKFDNITVTELAQKCQIERKTFYYHYENLEQLIKEISRNLTNISLGRIVLFWLQNLSWIMKKL